MATMWLDNPAPGGVAASVIATSFVLEKLRCAPRTCWVAWHVMITMFKLRRAFAGALYQPTLAVGKCSCCAGAACLCSARALAIAVGRWRPAKHSNLLCSMAGKVCCSNTGVRRQVWLLWGSCCWIPLKRVKPFWRAPAH